MWEEGAPFHYTPRLPKNFPKRIGMKTDMKKHDEKKQETAGSVSNRNHVKERKAKPKENDKCGRKRMKK